MSYYLKEGLKNLRQTNEATRAAKNLQEKEAKDIALLAEIERLTQELEAVKKTCNYLALTVQRNIRESQGAQDHYSIPGFDEDKKASGE